MAGLYEEQEARTTRHGLENSPNSVLDKESVLGNNPCRQAGAQTFMEAMDDPLWGVISAWMDRNWSEIRDGASPELPELLAELRSVACMPRPGQRSHRNELRQPRRA